MQVFYSESHMQTEDIAKNIAKTLKGGEVIAFRGDLGMGKTCFVRGLANGLECKDTVTSPTFALMNEYTGGRLPLYHFDMYRIGSWEDLYSVGFFDYSSAGGITAVEWSENIQAALPENTIYVELEKTGENSRKITVWSDEA